MFWMALFYWEACSSTITHVWDLLFSQIQFKILIILQVQRLAKLLCEVVDVTVGYSSI